MLRLFVTHGNPLGHYKNCTRCVDVDKSNAIEHTYTNTVDNSCDVCGYIRNISFDTSAVDTTSVYTGYAVSKSTITGSRNGVEGTWEWKNPEEVVNETGMFTAIFTPADGTASVEVEVQACKWLCHNENIFAKVFCAILKPFFMA